MSSLSLAKTGGRGFGFSPSTIIPQTAIKPGDQSIESSISNREQDLCLRVNARVSPQLSDGSFEDLSENPKILDSVVECVESRL
ncbi:hypothetical protein VCV18_012641 [Metarhizium anisopliae]